MKIESPLEVLSRAASIVQSEENSSDKKEDTTTNNYDENERNSPSPSAEEIDRERRSPKRQHHETNEKTFKRLKLEDKITSKSFSLNPKSETTTHSYAHPQASLPLSRQIKTTDCAPPPLISISETRKNLRNLPEYDALFPRPSVISSSPPSTNLLDFRYQSQCSADCKCKSTTSRYPDFSKKSTISSVITRDFELPTVDDHFRKSLGDKYDFSKSLHERPSSVDDHFAKALGNKWYSLGYGKCS